MERIEKNKISKKYLLAILGWLLIFSSFVDATMYFFKEEGKLTNFSIIRIIIYSSLFLIFFRVHKGIYFSPTSKLIIVFLVYTSFLIPFSSTINDSIESYFKVLLGMMMFVIGNNLLTSADDFKKIQFFLLGAAVIICIQLILSNIFGLRNEGLSSYNDDLITVGGGLVDNAKSLCFILLTFPVFFVNRISKRLRIILFCLIILSVITFLLYFNRSAMLGVIAGYSIIVLYSKNKKQVLRIVALMVLMTSVIVISLGSVLSDLFTERVVERDITTEARAAETEIVWGKLFEKPVYEMLLGTELYNSDFIDFGGDLYHGRQLHVDYNVLLVGTGIIGLLIYLLIIFSIWRGVMRFNKYLMGNAFYTTAKPVIFAVILASLIISYGGGIETVGFRSIFFLICGGILGVFRSEEAKILKLSNINLSKT